MRTAHVFTLPFALFSVTCWADPSVYKSLEEMRTAAPGVTAHALSAHATNDIQWVQGDGVDQNLVFDTCIKPGPSCFLYGSSVLLGGSGIHYAPIGSLATEISGRNRIRTSELTAVGVMLTGDYRGAYLAVSDPGRDYYFEVEFSDSGFLGIDLSGTGSFAAFSVGKRFYSENYANSFDISNIYTISAVPEPSSAALALVGLLASAVWLARSRESH